MPLRVYLADLTHTGAGIATEVFPLNIGLIASYAKRRFGPDIHVELFKYPEELVRAIDEALPHILGCSNYTWNANLSYHFVRRMKSIDRGIVTVFGGTNYPFNADKQRKFLEQRPALDLHTFYEGEVAFSHIIERYLGAADAARAFEKPVPGCQSIHRESGRFLNGGAVERMRRLDDIPSPYATGLLDQFFDGRLTPLLETARGCPFACNFCNAGDSYFNRMNLFSEEYVRAEWEYVARKASQCGAGHMILCDNNFGMIPRDSAIAELMAELKERFGWPRSVTAWTGKNSKERVIEVTRRLRDTLSISMSVQSMDRAVLRNIKRDNIKLDHYRAIADELNAQGRPQHAELIIPLPEETFQSHLASLKGLLDSGVGNIVTHTLQMLHGTPYRDDPAYVARHGFVRRHRVVPRDFGVYDGRYVFDTEEVAVGTKTFSPTEYVEARKLLLLIDLCYNGPLFAPLKRYLAARGLRCAEWIEGIYRRRDAFRDKVRAAFDSFERETVGELWDSEAALVAFYSRPENYARLVNGELGGNVLWRHKAWMLAEAAAPWIDTVFAMTRAMLLAAGTDAAAIGTELDALRRFIRCSVQDAFDLRVDGAPLTVEFDLDVLEWLRGGGETLLGDYRRVPPSRVTFAFDAEQSEIRRDALSRYGAGLDGVVKLIQRLGGVHRLTRRASATSERESCSSPRPR